MLKKTKLGLYDPKNEKDSCGIGFVANIYDIPSRTIVDNGLKILGNLTHRGAVSAAVSYTHLTLPTNREV